MNKKGREGEREEEEGKRREERGRETDGQRGTERGVAERKQESGS